jgi:iron complex transport system substrate-binding protein
MYDTWRLVGRVLDESDRAETLVGGVEDVVANLGARTSDRSERRRAYIGAINNKGAKGIDTTRNPFPPFRLTGTENVAAGVESDSASVQVSTEKLLAWDPPQAFVSTRNTERVADEIRENPELRQVSAVADGEVFKILPYAQYHVNYESILATSYYVGTTVYPEAFGDVSVKAKANEVFRLFHDTDLYEALASTFDMFEPLSIPEG